MSKWLYRGLGAVQDGATKVMFGSEVATAKKAFSELVDKSLADSKEVPMSNYIGSVLLVVNVASKWGLTKANYTQLPKLYDEYGARGLKILAFPCNQFGSQEPGSPEEIMEFVKKFDPDMLQKLDFFENTHVNGKKTREVFSFLKNALPSSDGTTDIRWNFAKFLVDHEGVPFKRYAPTTEPFAIKDDIETLLKKKEEDNK